MPFYRGAAYQIRDQRGSGIPACPWSVSWRLLRCGSVGLLFFHAAVRFSLFKQ
jgi:hypothetical protein